MNYPWKFHYNAWIMHRKKLRQKLGRQSHQPTTSNAPCWPSKTFRRQNWFTLPITWTQLTKRMQCTQYPWFAPLILVSSSRVGFELKSLEYSIIKLKILTYLTVLTVLRRRLTPNALQLNYYLLLASSDWGVGPNDLKLKFDGPQGWYTERQTNLFPQK